MIDLFTAAIMLFLAIVAVVALVALRGRSNRAAGIHEMKSEKFAQYFGDFMGTDRSAGVQEEDRSAPWGQPPG